MLNESDFDYWAAIEAAPETAVPNDMASFDLPAGLYAKCSVTSLEKLGEAYMYIYGSWISGQAEYDLNMQAPCFELYPQNWRPDTAFEIYVPVMKNRDKREHAKSGDSPKQVLARWIELFNRADAESLAELYHDDAVNHQVANEPVKGKKNIRAMFEQEFAVAEMVCIPENLFEDGEWAILEWRDSLGLRGCGFFHVIDGKIKFQRGYWDKLSFLKKYGLPFPVE